MGRMVTATALASSLAGVAAAATLTVEQTGNLGGSQPFGAGDAGSGDGATIDLFDGTTFDPFDTSLGTLTGARLFYDFSAAAVGEFDYFQFFESGSATAFYDGFYSIDVALDLAQFSPSAAGIASGEASVSDSRSAAVQPGDADTVPFGRSVDLVGDVAVELSDALQQDEGLTFEATAVFDLAADGGSFGQFPEPGGTAAFGGEYRLVYTYDDGMAPIPLPAGLPLLAAGLGALAILRRRA